LILRKDFKNEKIIPTLTLMFTFLVGCGMSDEEKANIAAVLV